MGYLSPAIVRGPSDYLGWLEGEYDIRIDARDLSDQLVREDLELYQAEFDAMVQDFYHSVDKIEKAAFSTCDSIEENSPNDADEKEDDVLEDARASILEESGRLAERLNSLNLEVLQGQSSPPLRSVSADLGLSRGPDTVSKDKFQFLHAWTCAESCGTIVDMEEYERHRTLNPKHHPQVNYYVWPPRRRTAAFDDEDFAA